MPALTYSVADFVQFTKIRSADVNSRFSDISTLLNTTKLDDDNLQDDGISGTKLKSNVAGSGLTYNAGALDVDAGADNIAADAITPPKLADITMQGPGTINLGLQAATTTNSNDSITITGVDGTALSASNPGYAILPGSGSGNGGELAVFEITAPITIDLTGAHWGLGTNGDATDYPLHVYAINDAGTVKWGVAAIPALGRIDGANDTTTPSSVTTVESVLVNSALSASANSKEIGWFRANFDDTGGAAEDLWTVQTGEQDIRATAAPLGLLKQWTPSGSWIANTAYTGSWARKDGGFVQERVKITLSGAPTSTQLTITPQMAVDETHLFFTDSNPVTRIGSGSIRESGVNQWHVECYYNQNTDVIDIFVHNISSSYSTLGGLNATIPATWGSGDSLEITYEYPVSGWDENIT